jgi:two-component system sensor histidine kinase VanS
VTNKNFKDRLTVLLMKQFSLVTATFTILLIILFLFVYYVGHQWITWNDPLGPFYSFFKFVDNYRFFTFMVFWGIGFVIITLFYWRRTIGYATQIIDSIERLYDSETELVKLPADLKDVEDELNSIKYNSLKSRQLAKEA